MHLIVIMSIFAILGLSLNLVIGYTGLLSLAHAAFFGIGAYTFAIMVKDYNLPFFIAIFASIFVGALISVLVGVVFSRFSGDYYALATLGFTSICYSAFLNLVDITGGPFGISGVPKPEIFGFVFSTGERYTVFIIVITALIALICFYITRSSFGRVLKSIREDAEVVSVFGYRVEHYRLVIFAISAGIASVAGGLYASYISYIGPSSFSDMTSIYCVLIIIIGGLSSHKGSLIGAIIYIFLPEILRFLGLPDAVAGYLRQMIFGVCIVALMMYKPKGIFGNYRL